MRVQTRQHPCKKKAWYLKLLFVSLILIPQIAFSALNSTTKIPTNDKIPIIRKKTNETLSQTLSRYVGRRVAIDFDSNLVVTQPFSYDFISYRDKMVLSFSNPQVKSTQLYAFGTEKERQHRLQNKRDRLYVETRKPTRNKGIPYYSRFSLDENWIRVGDKISGLRGVLKFRYGAYRLYVDDDVDLHEQHFRHVCDRQAPKPRKQASNIRLVSFNLMNYFVSALEIGGHLNPQCDSREDADRKKGCNRGAKTKKEFKLQEEKLVDALVELDADIVALIELENNGFGNKSAISYFIQALNERFVSSDLHYRFIQIEESSRYLDHYFGDDAIMVGLIYRPKRVHAQGRASILSMPRQQAIFGEEGEPYQVKQRDALVQRFHVGDSSFNVVVAHLKSKRLGCIEDDNKQAVRAMGGCNALRVSAAQVLGEFAKYSTYPTLLMGDLNAYAKEDPIRVLTEKQLTGMGKAIYTASSLVFDQTFLEKPKKLHTGYELVNVMDSQHAFSYLYDGELGSLDYILSTHSLADAVVQAYMWPINAYESAKLGYTDAYSRGVPKHADPFRSSDHDPLVVDLDI